MTQWLNEHAKAITSALVAGLVMFFALRNDGMTADEWSTVVSAVLAGGGLTWAVPNATNKVTTVQTSPSTLQVTEATDGPIPTAQAETVGSKHRFVLGDEDLH